MRAVVNTEYGGPDVLRILDVERPVPADNEVLVEVRATTVNRTDCGFRAPSPWFIRLFAGLRRPRRTILGSEFAGVVVEAGPAVREFAVGDEVLGVNADRLGAHAEYLCVRESAPITTKPSGTSFEEAAAVCDGAILAMTCLAWPDLGAGQSILIYGASGSIGTAGVQLAKRMGAEVTAVCNTENVEVVRSLGADEVLDYTVEDFAVNGQTYDVVFDAVGKKSFRECKGSLKDGGSYVSTDLGPYAQNVPADAVDAVRRVEEGDDADPPVHEGQGHPDQGARRGRRLPGRHRPQLPVGGRRRRDPLRRDRAEDGQRRPRRQVGRVTHTRLR
jgi:NADPH:quinone reductase-like Zn-dependent oxidoreductase